KSVYDENNNFINELIDKKTPELSEKYIEKESGSEVVTTPEVSRPDNEEETWGFADIPALVSVSSTNDPDISNRPESNNLQNQNKPGSGLKTEKIPPLHPGQDRTSIIGEVLSYDEVPEIYRNEDGGQSTTIHESQHGANTRVQNYFFNEILKEGNPDKIDLNKIKGFYLGNGEGIYLIDSGVTRDTIYNNFVPEIFKKAHLGYFTDSGRGWSDGSYILNEWTAAIREFEGSMELIDRNEWTTGMSSKPRFGEGLTDVGELSQFTTNALATATAVRIEKPEYWNNNPQYREFVAKNLVLSKELYDKTKTGNYNEYFLYKNDDYFSNLADTQKTFGETESERQKNTERLNNMRTTLKELLGEEYTRKHYGF
ncbi:MAG: hypothetical protein WC867_07735, partial [Candidatus Pacearchaeota archaeon]